MNNVMHLWGMQVANLKTGEIITASLPDHPPGDPGLLHGIGWTPDQKEVWESSSGNDPHVYVWAMDNPMVPVLKQTLTLKSALADLRCNRRSRLCRARQRQQRRHRNL